MASVGNGQAGRTLIGTGVTSSPTFAAIGTSSGLVAHGVVLSQGISAFTSINPGTTGQILTAQTGNNPIWASPAASAVTLTGNSGGALGPAASFSLLGTGSITISGSGTTLTTQLTGLTNHAVLIGAGTATITNVGPTATAGQVLQSAGASADPVFSTATFPSVATSTGTILRANGTNWVATTSTYPTTNAINTLLYASAANVMSALATANSAILNTSSGGVPSLATSPSVSGTITAGTGLTATTGAITATAGNVVITAGNLTLPSTNSGGSQGAILQNSLLWSHNFGTTQNVFLGTSAGNTSNTGSFNTGVGYQSLTALAGGGSNTCIGRVSGSYITSGGDNCLIGNASMYSGNGSRNNFMGSNIASVLAGVTGADNNITGYNAVTSLTSGSFNCAKGSAVLASLTTGSYNIVFGNSAGSAYASSESSNILLSSAGVIGESNTIRIGTAGTGNSQQSTCFIAGITGVTVTGTAVLCSATGQLGTIASSERYKENIVDMSQEISIMNLRPIEFNYKVDLEKRKQYGLLAEDVDRDFPYLCFYNEEKQPESVKYHELCTFLLHEMKKMSRRIEILEKAG